jgi:hypothetical protein
MRNDIIIDGKQVRLPNINPPLGYDKWKAQVGDVICWEYDGRMNYGRMIGRISYARPLAADEAGYTGPYLVVLTLHYGLDHASERWVRPEWVKRCTSPEGFAEFMAYFFGPDLPMGQDGRWLGSEGYLSVCHDATFKPAIGRAAKNRAVLAERKARIAASKTV